jgi:DNA-binding NarL/FixJ family response regulator
MSSDRVAPGVVLVVISDLLFRSRIDDVSRRLSVPLRVAKSVEQLERHLASGAPAMAIVDLEIETMDPVETITRIRNAAGGADTRLIAFAGHTNLDAIRAGRAAGAGVVLARSAFVTQLPALLGSIAEGQRAGPPSES